jgi:hypothetical protein
MLALPLLAAALAGVCPYSGRDGQTVVPIPRLAEADVAIDGALVDPVWSEAAVLCGFSEYSPADGRPADDSTAVHVWYSPHAIYVGIRASEPHGAVHAAHANRDRIANDDWVEIFLDTFNDRRQALVFGVNPLGVQADGTFLETQMGGKDTVDFSADFVYQSQGRLTDAGYEIEIRIPFKSIRYQPQAEQQWGINVVRQCSTPTPYDLTAASPSVVPRATRCRELRRGPCRRQPRAHRQGRGAPGPAGRTLAR